MKDKNYLLKFLKYMKFAKKEYIYGFILIILGILFDILAIKLLTYTFNENIEYIPKNKVFIFGLNLAIAYVVLKILEAIILVIRKKLLTRAGNKIYYNIQKMVYEHSQKLPIKYYDNMPAGSVLSRIVSDVKTIRGFFVNVIITTIIIIFEIGIIYSIMLYISPLLSIYILIFAPIVIILQLLNKKYTYKYSREFYKNNSTANGLANEMCQNLEIIAAFNNQEEIIKNWEKYSNERHKNWIKMLIVEALCMHNAFDFLVSLVKLSIITFYVYSFYNKFDLINISNTILFIFYTTKIFYSITNLTFNLSEYIRAKAASSNLYELLNLEQEKNEGKIKFEKFIPNIKLEKVYFSYDGSENYILKDINIDIKENESVAFVGHTGSGKSTITNLLVKFYNIQKGNIYISNEDIKNIDNEYLRENIAIVPQDPFLFEGSILENICDDESLAISSLISVGGEHILKERTINGKVSIDGTNFSAGEKQLISFARALAKNPKILILDEATSNIDSKTEQIIQYGIEVLKKGRTTLTIAHRLSTIRNSDKIIVLNKGVIVEQGKHDELVEIDGYYKKMIEMNNTII